jgi:hypothetical protein
VVVEEHILVLELQQEERDWMEEVLVGLGMV